MNKSFSRVNIKWLLLLIIFLLSVMPIFAKTPETETVTEPLITSTFFDSDLREAIKEVSMQSGVPILCDDNVKGVITMELKNVPLEKALRMLVSGGGFMYRKLGDYYIVGLPDPKNPTFALLCKTDMYVFKNISADSARALLPAIYINYVKIDSERNMATVSAPESIVSQIMGDLERMDSPKSQVKIKAILTEIQTEALKEIGTNLLNYSNTKSSRVRKGSLDTETGISILEGRGSFGYLKIALSALCQDKKATIQADPEITVAEGKTGQLFVGDKETLILRVDNNDISYSTNTQTVDAGITLKVTPKVFSDHMELTVNQQVSGIEERQVDSILVKTREFSSVINLLPGETIMVAGLTENRTKSDDRRTPILGRIPVLRFFFGKKSEEKIDSQLVLFLTAEVIK